MIEKVVWNTGIFSLIGDASGINVGRSQREMVRPMKHPLANADKTAMITERTLINEPSPDMAGLNRKYTITTRTALPSMMSGMIPGTAFITGDAAMINAVTGVMIASTMPHVSPAVSVASIRHRLTIGPVIYTLRVLKIWLAIHTARRASSR